MKKLNLLNAEESAKVNGGRNRRPDIPSCGTFDFKLCTVDYFPGCRKWEMPFPIDLEDDFTRE